MTDMQNPIFTSEESARLHLEQLRWTPHRYCPHCGESEQTSPTASKKHKPGLYYCNSCKTTFTVTVGTLFERSHVPLHKWILAFHLLSASKKGMSSHQLHRTLGVTYKTAWFMSHRIREAMKSPAGIMGSGGATVEADETYIGRKPYRRKHPGFSHKNAVVSLIERGGKVRSTHVPRVNVKNLKPILMEHVSRQARLITDEAGVYRPLGVTFEGGHETVNHSRDEYVRGDVYTNTAENFFSILKRGIYGVYHHVSEQHLQRYCHEFDFRYNYRQTKEKINGKWVMTGTSDAERALIALKGIGGKRLTYRRTRGAARD